MLVKQLMNILQTNSCVYITCPEWDDDSIYAEYFSPEPIPISDKYNEFVILDIGVTFFSMTPSLELTISDKTPDNPSSSMLYDLLRLFHSKCNIVSDCDSVYDGTIKSVFFSERISCEPHITIQI